MADVLRGQLFTLREDGSYELELTWNGQTVSKVLASNFHLHDFAAAVTNIDEAFRIALASWRGVDPDFSNPDQFLGFDVVVDYTQLQPIRRVTGL